MLAHCKTLLLIILGMLGVAAFFVSPQLCALYWEMCNEFGFLQHFDKVFHFMFFAAVALSIPLPRHILIKILICILVLLLGIGIEAVQYYIPHRGASLQDLLANTLGTIFGFTLRALIR